VVPSSIAEENQKVVPTKPPAKVKTPMVKAQAQATRAVPSRRSKRSSNVPSSKRRRNSTDSETSEVCSPPPRKIAKEKAAEDEKEGDGEEVEEEEGAEEEEEEAEGEGEEEEEGEEGEEAAADDQTEFSSHDYVENEPGPSSRTRRRGNPKESTRKPNRAFETSVRASRSLTTPLEGDSKRLRSFTSSTVNGFSESPTKVFALWTQDNHYYSGIVHSLRSGTKYLVKFDDGTDAEVAISAMRRNGLRTGDNILFVVDTRLEKARVVDDARIDSTGVITVEHYNGYQLEQTDVEANSVSIAARTIQNQWKDRVLTPDSIVTQVRQRQLKRTPSPSKASFSEINTGSGKSLLKTGIAITLTVKYNNAQGDKARLASIISNNGGTVIDDWFSVVDDGGKYSRNKKQWVAHGKDVKWVGKPSIERIFLLANDFSSKPKYLVALALGIPCLSLDWLHDTVKSVFVPSNFDDLLDLHFSRAPSRIGNVTCFHRAHPNR
jgi:DNA repair protein Crb2 Tudor domain/BRCA1 C Terminus (BRCT) domain